jgi:pyruvate,water dikinase
MTAVYGARQYEFDEKNDLVPYGAWFCDITHGTPPWTPLFILHGWMPFYRTIQRSYELLSVPACRGTDARLKDGYPYVTMILTNEEEARQRAPLFRERIRIYIENSRQLWDESKRSLIKDHEDLRAKHGVSDYGSISSIRDIELMDLLDEYLRVNKLQTEVHHDFMISGAIIFGLLEQMCRTLTHIDRNSALFGKVMSGFDSSTLRFNKAVWGLGTKAAELGLTPAFSATDEGETILAELASSDTGTRWLRMYDEFLRIYGWRCNRAWDWATPTWLEQPALGMPLVKMAAMSGTDASTDEKMEQAQSERKEAEAEILAQVPLDQRDWFEQLMGAAQMAPFWNADHNLFLDLPYAAMGRWITKEMGTRLAAAGTIDDAEDIYFLDLTEIYRGFIPMGRARLQRYVDERKKEWEGYLHVAPAPLLGDPAAMQDMMARDPYIQNVTCVPNVRPELEADIYGGASAPGIGEGQARVIMSADQLGQLEPGEILVAPGTSSQWAPAFELIKGIVTDGGGALSHAVINAREYGIPAVTGCQREATKAIKTGDRIRVDGDLGVVFILETR